MLGQRELKSLPLTPIPTAIREDCLALRRLLDEQIRRLAEICYQVWKEETDFLAVLRRGGARG